MGTFLKASMLTKFILKMGAAVLNLHRSLGLRFLFNSHPVSKHFRMTQNAPRPDTFQTDAYLLLNTPSNF